VSPSGAPLTVEPEACSAAAPRPARPRLVATDLGRTYGPVAALQGVSLVVADGEIVCLLGPSGSGKSTLLRLLAGIERPSSGRLLLDGVEVAGGTAFVEPDRRRVGMVFQDYALFPHLDVSANVAFGLRGRSHAERQAVVDGLLDRVGLRSHARRFPHELSGGERQRVALARALAPGPRVLLMDEPFSSLDERLRNRVRQQTVDLLREMQATAVVVTHDPDEAMRIGDRIALLRAGRLVQCDTPEALYTRPGSLFAARFFSEMNELPTICGHGFAETVLGRFAALHIPGAARAVACVRPQHLRLVSSPAGVAATVVSRTFLGEVEQLALSVAALESPLRLRTSGRTGLAPGALVRVEVHPADVIVLADDDS
jgi:iron(III) transport system ATP-binding protein